MITGVGIDLVPEAKVEPWLGWTERRLERLLAPCEREDMAERGWGARHLAARIAAKEAFYKATGLSCEPNEVGVERGEGAPRLWLAERLAARLDGVRLHLSLSHEGGLAAAVVVAERA